MKGKLNVFNWSKLKDYKQQDARFILGLSTYILPQKLFGAFKVDCHFYGNHPICSALLHL